LELLNHAREILTSKRLAVIGFDFDEQTSIISALNAARAFANPIDPALNPRLISLAQFDLCVVNLDARARNGDPRPWEIAMLGRRAMLAIGSLEEVAECAHLMDSPNRDYIVRPYQAGELIIRAARIARTSESIVAGVEEAAGPSGRDVVLADDDEAVDILVSTILKHNGFTCRIARDGVEALALVRAAKPSVVLLDVSMPEKDGFETLKELRADPTTRDIPVIMLTATNRESDIVRAFQAGATDYITKPFHSGELVARLNRVLADIAENHAAL
jgi:DNA-binding response OmpR family regulator